jgi:exoribonuclease R
MPRLRLRAPHHFEQAFAGIRRELDIPDHFPSEVLAEAEASTAADVDRYDARHLALVAIDPEGATDLDQAYFAQRLGSGFRVFYAIADVGAFVRPGGAVDTEARKRGATLYSPDLRTPLHPTVLSEDRASLLAGVDRPALLWTIDLDSAGVATANRLQRALVRIDEAISYVEAQHRIDHQTDERLTLLAEIGGLRQAREVERGGVSLNLPAQEIVEQDGSYRLAFDRSLPVESWNAQISLLTGMVAGRTMLDAGVGVLRTLPPPNDETLGRLRRSAGALGLDWADTLPYPEFVRTVAPDSPATNAFLIQAARSFRGAGYVGFNGERPQYFRHGAISSVYAHVTAPLRRLVDRFGNEILLALHAGAEPPAWAVEALDELPSLMGKARQAESSLERALLDMAEALVLEHRIGDVFDAAVVDINHRRNRAVIQIADPAIVDEIPAADHHLGGSVKVRVERVDTAAREVDLTPIDHPG